MKSVKSLQSKKKQPGRSFSRTTSSKEDMLEYYKATGVPEPGQLLKVQAPDSEGKEVMILSVTMTHVFVRFPDTRLSDNVPHWIFRIWLSNAAKAAKAAEAE